MVPNASQLLTKTNTFLLNQSLTFAHFGIYVAICVLCHEQCVGQTSNKFSKRWSAHRSNWNKQDCKLTMTKWPCCSTINKCSLHEAYTVTFVKRPSSHITYLTRKLRFRTWSFPMWNNYYNTLLCVLWKQCNFTFTAALCLIKLLSSYDRNSPAL